MPSPKRFLFPLAIKTICKCAKLGITPSLLRSTPMPIFGTIRLNMQGKNKNSKIYILKETILSTLEIKEEEVAACFGATPKTFLRYIKREQLGGNAMSMKNFLPLLPGNDTEIKGLYQVGDSVYPAQGWPGVMMGVKNLIRLLDA